MEFIIFSFAFVVLKVIYWYFFDALFAFTLTTKFGHF